MNTTHTYAEKADRINTAVAAGMFFMALAYAAMAGELITSETVANYFNYVGKGVMIIAVIIILWACAPLLLKLGKKRSARCNNFSDPEGFITQAFHKSCLISWFTLFIGLSFLAGMDNLLGRLNLPVQFYLYAILSVILFVASISFFVITLTDDENEA